MFCVVYFVFKKASKPLGSDDKTRWLSWLRYIFYVNLIINAFFVTIIEIDVYKYEYIDEDLVTLKGTWNQQFKFEKVFCSSKFWIVNSFAEVVQIFLFYLVVRNISKQVH